MTSLSVGRVATALLLLTACARPAPAHDPAPGAEDPAVAPPADAPPLPAASSSPDACTSAEVHLLTLQCLDDRGVALGSPNRHNQPWAALCRELRARGVDLRPDCLLTAKTCQEADRCR